MVNRYTLMLLALCALSGCSQSRLRPPEQADASTPTSSSPMLLTQMLDCIAHHDSLSPEQLQQRLTALVEAAREPLRSLYESDLADSVKRDRKQRYLAQLQADLATEFGRSGRAAPDWSTAELNNARLASISLYQGRVGEFRDLYEACDRDLHCFYGRASSLRAAALSTRR